MKDLIKMNMWKYKCNFHKHLVSTVNLKVRGWKERDKIKGKTKICYSDNTPNLLKEIIGKIITVVSRNKSCFSHNSYCWSYFVEINKQQYKSICE